MMMTDIKQDKEDLREHARRTRSLLTLDSQAQKDFCTHFFSCFPVDENVVVSSYWPIGREFDTHILTDEIIERGGHIALPVIQEGSRVLRFARWTPHDDVEMGKYGICQPVVNDQTEHVDPDILVIPLLAFDRRGYRLGYGGGYYDSTLSDIRSRKNAVAVGIGFSQQACLFNLPVEDHDIRMDYIITEQGAQKFS